MDEKANGLDLMGAAAKFESASNNNTTVREERQAHIMCIYACRDD